MRALAALLLAATAASAQPVPITVPGARYVVPPPTIDAPKPPPVAAPAPPVETPRPSTLTTCDPGGCWDSQGRRLERSGPVLVTPRGACTTAGGVVQCP